MLQRGLMGSDEDINVGPNSGSSLFTVRAITMGISNFILWINLLIFPIAPSFRMMMN